MGNILYVKATDETLISHDAYTQILSDENYIHMPISNTQIDANSLEIRGHGSLQTGVNKYVRLFLNLLFFSDWDEIDTVFSSHREWYYGVLNVLFAKLHGKQSVVCFAGNIFNSYKYKRSWWKYIIALVFNKILAMQILRHADTIVPYSNRVKNHLIEHGVDETKIQVIRIPRDFEEETEQHERACEDLQLAEDKTNVLFVGTLTKGKGTETFLSLLANEEIRQRYRFIFAGQDRDGYGKRLEVFPNTSVLGRIPLETVYNYYKCADLFVFPSYSEGFPKVVLEAYTCGMPIVSRDISDVHLLADATFDTDDELLDILLTQSFKRDEEKTLPKEFTYSYVKEQYLELFR